MSILRHQLWLIDAKILLESVLEITYLWSQGFTLTEIIHELKLSKKAVIEWSTFFQETCLTIMLETSQQIGSSGVEVEIDESKFGKHKYIVDIKWKANGYLAEERSMIE